MDTRASISAILDQAYAARRAQDVDTIAALFTHDGHFEANGNAPAKLHTERIAALKGLFDAFEVVQFHEHCRVIDPPRAVVHWRGDISGPQWPPGGGGRARPVRAAGRQDRCGHHLLRHRLCGGPQRTGLSPKRQYFPSGLARTCHEAFITV